MVCHWFEERDGSRILIPGCHTRINDPDTASCDCAMVVDKLNSMSEKLAVARRELEAQREWNRVITEAVYAHPDGTGIMHKASLAIPRRTR
jgi:hypothetical protein